MASADCQDEIHPAGLCGVMPRFPRFPMVVEGVALGATTVGRPYASGLARGGEAGLVHVPRALPARADLIMAVDGCPTLAGLTTSDSLHRLT
ncbi:alpha-hydroxy-acid oxidizing protein [Streptomyces sp. NPDC059466]|uniref:alpha-hydroxy-acid oxidizing protein n=1 Tax=unclassified Streptomyces TaxID=2593676 RepID=UPI0036C692D3